MSLLVFDIETRVDKALLRQTQFADLEIGDDEAYERMREQLRHESGGRSDFFPVTYHVPISIALVQAGDDCALQGVEVLGADRLGEEGWYASSGGASRRSRHARVVQRPRLRPAGARAAGAAPRLRAAALLRTQRAAPAFRPPRRSPRLARQPWRRAAARRARSDRQADRPAGQSDVAGGDVQRLWERGRWADIHRYCADDAVQTYFILLRVEQLRGTLTPERVAELTAAAQASLRGGAA
jgi:hypothetical protein